MPALGSSGRQGHDRPRNFTRRGWAVGLLVLLLWASAGLETRLRAADVKDDTKSDTKPAAEPAPATQAPAPSVEALTESARKSVVVITYTGRDGKRQGLGSGFIIAADGLIATNLHVIGEARPISVQLTDGRSFDVTSVDAFDRPQDLALVRIDAKDLPALTLGDSDTLKQGQPVIALGNPHGLKYSVVSGIVSGTREIDGRNMIQLAMPIEPGNSGGPLIDMQGRVHGIITMKSLVTDNLGFAVTVNALKPLIEKPNPTTMARWLTIGALDAREWTPLLGARWRQRAGRILVDGLGQGFGGRSLCISEQAVPQAPFELAVSVKLDHEEGAAGLVFCSDGGDRHYGFYPTNGRLRLSRFDGADVFTWKVLDEQRSDSYRPNDWNTLKVRFESGKIQCYCNDQLVITSNDDQLTSGKVGLAKFRTTEAEFRGFRVAANIEAEKFSEELLAKIGKISTEIPPRGPLAREMAETLLPDGNSSVTLLREQAQRMERQAAQLRSLARAVHERRVQQELAALLKQDEAQIDLFRATLLVAQLDNDELEPEPYLKLLDRMAHDVQESVPKDADERARVAALTRYLFEEQGFHGSRGDYYHKSNSYVNEVLDDREGLPITLSVLYIEMARRVGVKVVGVGLPGHFVVRHEPAEGEPQFLDPYERGAVLSREDVEKIVRENTGRPLAPEHTATATKSGIILRMLHNLMGLAQRDKDAEGMLRYVETIVAVTPMAGEERWMRAVLRFQTGRIADAIEDADWLLDHKPEGVDMERVNEFRNLLERSQRS